MYHRDYFLYPCVFNTLTYLRIRIFALLISLTIILTSLGSQNKVNGLSASKFRIPILKQPTAIRQLVPKDISRKEVDLSSHPSQNVMFHNKPLFQSILVLTLCNMIGLLVSLFINSHNHIDFIGTVAYAFAAIVPIWKSEGISHGSRRYISTAAVTMWSVKLSFFLFFRVLKLGHDGRLEEIFKTVGGTIGFWTLSLLWSILCSLPHTLGSTSSQSGHPILLIVGSIVYILGFYTESLADYQKWIFQSSGTKIFCNVGLWSISQQPNFFGNILLWLGILIINSDSLIEPLSYVTKRNISGIHKYSSIIETLRAIWPYRSRRLFTASLSPIFMYMLLSSQVNAIRLQINPTGETTLHEEYLWNVPLIIPYLDEWIQNLFY